MMFYCNLLGNKKLFCDPMKTWWSEVSTKYYQFSKTKFNKQNYNMKNRNEDDIYTLRLIIDSWKTAAMRPTDMKFYFQTKKLL